MVELNQSYLRLFGFSREEKLIGHSNLPGDLGTCHGENRDGMWPA